MSVLLMGENATVNNAANYGQAYPIPQLSAPSTITIGFNTYTQFLTIPTPVLGPGTYQFSYGATFINTMGTSNPAPWALNIGVTSSGNNANPNVSYPIANVVLDLAQNAGTAGTVLGTQFVPLQGVFTTTSTISSITFTGYQNNAATHTFGLLTGPNAGIPSYLFIKQF